MLSEDEKVKLDSLSTLFLGRLGTTFPHGQYEASFTDRLEVRFPAVHQEVGDIHVWLDGDEITVGIGDYFHTHFDTYFERDTPEDQAESQAVENALIFINDFLSEKIVLEISYSGLKPTAADVHYLEGEGTAPWVSTGSLLGLIANRLRRRRTTKHYVWSGPWSPEKKFC